jgi:hypothetical protein
MHVYSLRTHFRCLGVAGSTAIATAREMQNPRKGRVMQSFHRHGTGGRHRTSSTTQAGARSLLCTSAGQSAPFSLETYLCFIMPPYARQTCSLHARRSCTQLTTEPEHVTDDSVPMRAARSSMHERRTMR